MKGCLSCASTGANKRELNNKSFERIARTEKEVSGQDFFNLMGYSLGFWKDKCSLMRKTERCTHQTNDEHFLIKALQE